LEAGGFFEAKWRKYRKKKIKKKGEKRINSDDILLYI
jgi:hypothetical protein